MKDIIFMGVKPFMLLSDIILKLPYGESIPA